MILISTGNHPNKLKMCDNTGKTRCYYNRPTTGPHSVHHVNVQKETHFGEEKLSFRS